MIGSKARIVSLLGAGALAGGILAGTLSANAATTGTTAATSSTAASGSGTSAPANSFGFHPRAQRREGA